MNPPYESPPEAEKFCGFLKCSHVSFRDTNEWVAVAISTADGQRGAELATLTGCGETYSSAK